MANNIETIGGLIQRLFRDGFMNHEYWFLINSNDKTDDMKDETSYALLIDAVVTGTHIPVWKIDSWPENKNEPSYFKALIESKENTESKLTLYDKELSEKFPSLPKALKKYQIPPLSPFDLFAITSTLLLKSGAYHHFEAALEGTIFDKKMRTREPNKTKFIKCTQINHWRKISESWYKYCNEDSNSDPFTGSFIEKKPEADKYPENLIDYWQIILKDWNEPVYTTINDMQKAPEWWDATYSLMAIADLTAKNAGYKRDSNNHPPQKKLVSCWSKLAEMIINRASDRPEPEENFKDLDEIEIKHLKEEIERGKAFESIRYVESISLAERSFVNIMPKSKTASLGCTLRSISHNLANLPGNGIIRTGWAWATDPPRSAKQNPVFNMLLIPYPYEIHSTNFTTTAISQNSSTDCEDASKLRWGAFTLNVPVNKTEDEDFIDFVSRLIREGNRRVGCIHAIVLPELALSRKSIIQLRNRITANHPSIELICSGMREHPYKDGKTSKKPIAVNGAYMASIDSENKEKTVQHDFFHEKHHRWRVTEQQINDYDLAPALDPSRTWWEDIRIVNRRLPILIMRDQWSVTTLICEDLARNDPAKSIVESVGPNLVISLLMDGPQTIDRWSARYATVLADDPGSSVLSMSSFGLINRSNKVYYDPKKKPSRSFALWRDDRGESQTIELDEGNHASVVSLSAFPFTDHTMDGRADSRSVTLRLTGQRQIRDKKTEGYPPWGASAG